MPTREELYTAARRVLASSEFQLLATDIDAGLREAVLTTDPANVVALQHAAFRYEAFREMMEYFRQTAT